MGGLFICWSKPRSRQVAEALHRWLPSVLGRTGKPFLSVEIAKGRVWLTEVSRALKRSKAAIVCLTPENLDSPWMHFEAGAVAHSLGGSSIFTYLHGVAPEEVQGPLQSFQSTVSTREDTRRLFQHKTFTEPMPESKDKDWKARFRRLIATREDLAPQGSRVRRLAAPHIASLFDELLVLLDGYEMEMATLVDNKPVETAGDGRLVFDVDPPPGERRRVRVRQVVASLLEPIAPPVLAQSLRYSQYTTTEERKEQIVHPAETLIAKSRLDEWGVDEDRLERCADSPWDFDRIFYYLVHEARRTLDARAFCDRVRRELERARTAAEPSLMPLHYAVRGLLSRMDRSPGPVDVVSRTLGDVTAFLDARPGRARDDNEPIRGNLAEIGRRLRPA